jgi:parallel beta-helix repeat protein
MRRLTTLIVVAAVATGLAACQPSGDCGRVLTRDTTLRADVVNCPGDGLVIGADGIEIRLAGHTVDGTEAVGSAGIRVAGHDDVVVRGPGLVRGFDDGVRVEDATDDRVRDLTVTGNHFGIHLVGAHNSRVVANDVSSNEAFLSSDAPLGLLLEDSDDNLLSGNTVFEDDFSCIQLVRSHRNRIVGNAANHADGTNIALSASHDNEVVGNDATVSNGDGIALADARRNLVADNRVGDASSAGIRVRGGGENRVVRNVSLADDTDGIDVVDSSSNLIEANEVTEAGVRGISLRTFSGTSTGNRVRGNAVTDGRPSLRADGIAVAAGVASTVVRGNTTNGSSDDGIDVDATGTTIRDNVADGNGDLGIEAVAGVVDGGGNRARGNGNPAQCTGVVCP